MQRQVYRPVANNRQKSPMRYVQRALLRALITVAALYGIFGWVLGITTAPNNDMYPRVSAGDLLLYYRLDKEVKAQDVVVLEKNGTRYVGRVVAVGGDTVEITDSQALNINGSTMVESNIFYPTPVYEGFVEYPLTLGAGECFVLADSRNGGEDSRYYGPVRQDELLGTVITIVRRNNL